MVILIALFHPRLYGKNTKLDFSFSSWVLTIFYAMLADSNSILWLLPVILIDTASKVYLRTISSSPEDSSVLVLNMIFVKEIVFFTIISSLMLFYFGKVNNMMFPKKTLQFD